MKDIQNIIEIKNVSKSFGDKCILNDVSISVKQGEWHNIRIVTYTVDEVVIFKVYVDGVYTMDIRTANNTKTSSSKRLTLYMQELDENNDDFILVDNIYLGYTDVAYVEGAGN